MSFLGGRLAGKEAAYFFQESKHAVNRIAEKSPPTPTGKKLPPPSPGEIQPDVLPEILRHSLPPRLYGPPPDPSSLSQFSKWNLPSDPNAVVSISPDVLNPLRGYVSLPQVTFGRRRFELYPTQGFLVSRKILIFDSVLDCRWDIPKSESSVSASTANELRRDRYGTRVNPDKLRAAGEGLQHSMFTSLSPFFFFITIRILQLIRFVNRPFNFLVSAVGKAFAAATVIVFGSATLVFGTAASKLDMRNVSLQMILLFIDKYFTFVNLIILLSGRLMT